jgi:hypothetical protein
LKLFTTLPTEAAASSPILAFKSPPGRESRLDESPYGKDRSDEKFRYGQTSFKIINLMSPRMTKLSKSICKNPRTKKGIEKLTADAANGRFTSGRRPRNLDGVPGIF